MTDRRYNPYPPGTHAHAIREIELGRQAAAARRRNPHPPDTLAHALAELRLACADLAGAIRHEVGRIAYRVQRTTRRER